MAYQKGFGGHFHNDNSLAVFRDIPGLIIGVPCNGAEAVRMLRTCVREAHERGRVSILVEPIALYMTRDLHETQDQKWMFPYPEEDEESPLGEIGLHGEGEVVILTYGNGTYHSLRAQKQLFEKHGFSLQVMDLKWIAPLDGPALAKKLKDKTHILFVEECRVTGSFAEGVIAGLSTRLEGKKWAIHGAQDCFIPLGPGATLGLPNESSIEQAVISFWEKGHV